MKLISLQLIGSGRQSWSSEVLFFGERLTQLFASNGAGKTPLVQSIVFALGYKVDYRDDIVDRCDYVELVVAARGREYIIRRRIKGGFSVTVAVAGEPEVEFVREREYSRFLLMLWGLDDRLLTTVRGESTPIYSLQILPLFYLDQDHGYANEYFSVPKFIKDQYAEVVRIVFGLPPKNSSDKQRQRRKLLDELDRLDQQVVFAEKAIAGLTSDLNAPRQPVDAIELQLNEAVASLEALGESRGSSESVNEEIEARIAFLRGEERTLVRELGELKLRVRGFGRIREEIEVEADTLSLNEEARRVFASFDEICSTEGCGLFLRSSRSYGKSLLYLRDQIKDLTRANAAHERRIDEVERALAAVRAELFSRRSALDEVAGQGAVAALVEVVSRLTETVIHLKRARQIELELARRESEYVDKLEERARIQSQIDSLSASGGVRSVELLRVQNSLAERIKFWLDILRTPNVGRNVEVDGDFNVEFDGQKVVKFKGSTLTRVVLAIRAAVFDLLSARPAAVPRFLILDTPRQQDISRDDLAVFVRELQALGSSRGVQIVISTTNHRYELGVGDAEWVPTFPGVEHPMFLGEVPFLAQN